MRDPKLDMILDEVINYFGTAEGRKELSSRMDAYFSERDAKEDEYRKSSLENDYAIIKKWLINHPALPSDINDYAPTIDVSDISLFCDVVSRTEAVPVSVLPEESYCAGAWIYRDIRISLHIGQGSFYLIEKYNPSIWNGDGI